MMKINYKEVSKWLIIAGVLSIFIGIVLSVGCVSASKNLYTELKKTPTPTPTPKQTPASTVTILQQTPKQTPASTVTILQQQVNLFYPGERWEGQWYQWKRDNVSGYKDLHAGIIVYRHGWLDSYHWYNPAVGNYMVQKPGPGNRYFVVWVHQESIGKEDPGFFPFYEDSFLLQVKDQLIKPDTVHNPVCRILEFDHKYDYYNMITAPPFGYFIRQIGKNPETGGYVADRVGEVRYGQGNSVDGYILYEVPKNTMEEDLLLLGSFDSFGSAYWKFTK